MTTASEFKFSLDVKEGRSGYPLIRFRGMLKECTPMAYTPEDNPGAKPRMSLKFDFTDITVVETMEPYSFPITTITVPYSDRAETRWAAWAKSLKLLVPSEEVQKFNQPFEVLVGKVQEWAWAPAKLRMGLQDENNEPILDAVGKQKWGVVDADAWQIISVEGYGSAGGGVNIHDLIIEYLDGKTDKDFMQWLYTDQSIKSVPGQSAAVEAQSERKLLPMLIQAGKLTQDAEGIYHRVDTGF